MKAKREGERKKGRIGKNQKKINRNQRIACSREMNRLSKCLMQCNALLTLV